MNSVLNLAKNLDTMDQLELISVIIMEFKILNWGILILVFNTIFKVNLYHKNKNNKYTKEREHIVVE